MDDKEKNEEITPKAPAPAPAAAKVEEKPKAKRGRPPGRPSKDKGEIETLKKQVAELQNKLAAKGQVGVERQVRKVTDRLPVPEGADSFRVHRAAGVIPAREYHVVGTKGNPENGGKTVETITVAVDEGEAINHTVTEHSIGMDSYAWKFRATEAVA